MRQTIRGGIGQWLTGRGTGLSKSGGGVGPIKSHMPKGATQTPKGDLGERRVKESDTQRGFKSRGAYLDASEAFGANAPMPGSMGEK